MTMISSIVTILATQLTEAQRDALAERAQWVVLNRRNDRLLIDIIGARDDLQWILAKLQEANLDPVVCAAWNAETGKRIKGVPLRAQDYLVAAPDVVTYDVDGNETSRTRPTAYVQQHEWAGWQQHRPGEVEP